MKTATPSVVDAHPRVGPVDAGLILLTAALWGGVPVAIRFSAESFPPIAMAGWRFALGSLVMVIWCRWEGAPLLPRSGMVRPAVIAGLLLFVQISLFNWGVAYSNASHGSMLLNTFIFWVVVIEHYVTKADRLSLLKIAGLLLATTGAFVVLVTAPSDTKSIDAPSLGGDLLLLASAFVLGIKVVYIKQAVRHVRPSALILWHDVIGVALFASYSLAFEPMIAQVPSTAAMLGILFQGVLVAGLCFAIQALMLRKYSASQITVFGFTTPLFGVVFAVLMRGDHLSPWLLVSVVSVAVGILLTNMGRGSRSNNPG